MAHTHTREHTTRTDRMRCGWKTTTVRSDAKRHDATLVLYTVATKLTPTARVRHDSINNRQRDSATKSWRPASCRQQGQAVQRPPFISRMRCRPAARTRCQPSVDVLRPENDDGTSATVSPRRGRSERADERSATERPLRLVS